MPKVALGSIRCCLPVIPAVIICIPTINMENPIIMPARNSPNIGDPTPIIEMRTFYTPTPKTNALIQP